MGSTINSCFEKRLIDKKKMFEACFSTTCVHNFVFGTEKYGFCWNDFNKWSFLRIVAIEFDLVLKKHLDKDCRIKYLKPKTKDELISIIGHKICSVILNELIHSKYYQIIVFWIAHQMLAVKAKWNMC